jgi:hypothetical protein
MPVRIPWAVPKASYFLRYFHPIPDNQGWRGRARLKRPDERVRSSMNLRQVRTPDVKVVSSTDSLQSAALLMREK